MRIVLLIAASCLMTCACAMEGAIDEILVVGARLPRPVQDVVGTVDVITRDSLLEQVAVRAEDAFRYVPGVSVTEADARFGATEFTIRGLSGNRVSTLIDGVPVADQFDIGAFANAGQDFLVADAVSRIEVLRGPASTLFGSDALGGVVAVVTRDPENYLRGRDLSTEGALTYSGADQSRVLSGALAGRSGTLAGVLHGAYHKGEERDAAGTDQEDPLQREQLAAMLKLDYALPNGALRMKGEAFSEQVTSRPEAVLGYGRQFANTTSLEGDDERERFAVQLEYDFDVAGRWAEAGRIIGYAQRSEVDQRTFERREALTPALAIERRFDYQVKEQGALADLESRLQLGTTEHRLGWGLSLHRAEIVEQRDGLQRNLATGDVSNVLLGEMLPVRDFPKSVVTEAAIYVHDEIELGRLTVIPGVRLEHYRLDARSDPVYREDHPTLAVEDLTETALVPKLGVQWRVNDETNLFVQYARGLRAPPFEDVNIGLEYSVPFPVRAIANPELKAETSDGIELGLRHRGARWGGEIALFGARYDDFIESKASLGFDPTSGALLFQSRNIEQARVYGIEGALSLEVSESLTLQTRGSWTRGDNRVSDEPLNTVDPPSLAMQLRWQPDQKWRAGVALRAATAKDRLDDSRVDLFQPDGYMVFDVTAGYVPRSGMRVNAGVFNVTDKTYWRWASVRGRPVDDPAIDVLAAPGRYAAVSLRLDL